METQKDKKYNFLKDKWGWRFIIGFVIIKMFPIIPAAIIAIIIIIGVPVLLIVLPLLIIAFVASMANDVANLTKPKSK